MTQTKKVTVGEIELAYETFGEATDPTLLLVMGLGTQMIGWPDPFCEQLAAAGRYVVRFDNRDAGLSTHLDGVRAPSPMKVFLRRERPPYRIRDLAADTLGLMDALGLGLVDLVGISMGGFIAQTVALTAPERLRTLTLIMTSTGAKTVGFPSPTVGRQLMRGRPTITREEVIEAAVVTFRLIGSPGYELDEGHLRLLAAESFDRSYDPPGYLRQLAACLAQPDRTSRLRGLDVPTLVMHGLHDPLVHASGGMALARAIPRARFVGFSGMGHHLPTQLWGPLASEIVRHVHEAQVPV